MILSRFFNGHGISFKKSVFASEQLRPDVVVSGDFFLYPEEALHDITHALDGLPADLPAPDIADRVAAAIPAGTEWLGSSADALALAVHRARTEPGTSNA